MKKRIVATALTVLLMASITSCSNDGTLEDTSDVGSTADTEVSVLPAGIEKCNYGGKEIKFLAIDWGLYKNYFFAEDNKGDTMNQEIYKRRLLVEDHLGVSLTHEYVVSQPEMTTLLQSAVMSGDDDFQVLLGHCIRNISTQLTSDLLLDLNTVDAINFDEEWWNGSAIEALSTKNKQYYAIGDFMIPDPNAILFNKQLIDEHELEDPYALVRGGEWTIDKMMEMASHVTLDNGDSVWDTNDTYGFSTPDNWFLSSFIYSSGMTLTEVNDEGEFEFAFGSEKAYTLMEKLESILTSPDTIIHSYTKEMLDKDVVDISTGRCLFYVTSLNRLNLLRDSTVEYGILPYPKLDAEQDGYYNNDWSGLMCVPVTVKDPEMVGKAIELLNYYSAETTVPAYYDLVLGEKLSRDEDSKEMLEIIFDGVVFDAGMNYLGFESNMNMLFYTPEFMVNGKSYGGFSSWLAKYETGARNEITAFNEAVAALD
ncbi:MAG: hypothetical protein IJ428_03020 [Clostridia bacterium]|nr:hypothetical protein [Clostridia bacterium]